MDDCYSLAESLRDAGYSVEMPFVKGKLGTLFKKAVRAGAKFALIAGEDDLNNGAVQVKNLATQEQKSVLVEDLQDYPCLAFEQRQNNSFYFAEEMKSTYEYKKIIKADDRATMLNLMVGLNGYTLCSGIICEELNGSDYTAVPLAEKEIMTIGYIQRRGMMLSPLAVRYLEEIRKYETCILKDSRG